MVNQQIYIENVTMKEILISMHRLGGQITRKEIRQDIRDNSQAITENQVDMVKTSKRSGNKYKPFDYTFYYAVKYLIVTGYINTDDNYELELSEKGRTVDLNTFDPERDVRTVIRNKKAEKNKLNVNDPGQIETGDAVEDSEDASNQWRKDLLDALIKMNPKKFEIFCRGLLKRMGVEVDNTIGVQYVADGGLDGFGYVRSDDYRTTRVALQAKRWQSKVSAPEIDKFRGAMDKFNAEFGIFITNSDFTREAVKTARQGTRIITLINGDQICDLVAKYNYYVEPVTTYRLKSFYTDND
ncbi:restriction endonuclease [Lactobacillus acetotolerans]|uniref:restriction endonuclease n=1 Tax=Lactobacillus acetotolerans TaxID=1600 RepID=UPI0007BA86AF|nr:restriction endonuclease [Lactobacillus acetotolerans]QGV04240.1 restriction endonuclease [Lactobacillus acetotolerans]